ncbi:MAG: hypothetical protein MUF52_12905 [Syntrophobacteraceae bacterium]|jgi:hypothetical protein|nr:hypothetical protein [Syntrophobacteraceae bacterium]
MIGFIYHLQDAGIPVSVRYILELYRALGRGLARDLDELFLLTRLIFVKRVEHYDVFEQAFASFFLGAEGTRPAVGWEELIAGKPFQDWLRDQLEQGLLTPEELREFDTEELLARFWETVLDQKGEHRGGNRWVGTRGRSPFGHGGMEAGGIRVYGRSLRGSAQKVIDDRRYINYSEQSSLSNENLRQALTSMRSLRPLGPENELDIDATIAQTARNGGEIELIFRRELRNRLKLFVMLDNGGYSMTPYVSLVKVIFNKLRDIFMDVSFFYFHNCIYGTVYQNPERTRSVKWEKLTSESKSTRLILIGDANMAPAELMAAYGSIDLTQTVRKPGKEWLAELKAAYPVSVWLNPIRKSQWSGESATIQQIGRIFRMEDLTLAGIKEAVSYLNIQGQTHDRR